MKRLLFVVGDGIGNQAQTIPALLYCKQKYNCPIDVYNSIPRNTESTKVIFKSLSNRIYVNKEKINQNEYFGQVLNYPFFQKRVGKLRVVSKNVSNLMTAKKYSEVDMNLRSVGSQSSKYHKFNTLEALDWIIPKEISPDIIVHNGFSKVTLQARRAWEVKSYPHYAELAKLLIDSGFTVGSIGSKDEYVEGTQDLTGLSFEDSLSKMKGSKLFIANDTGTYHLANLLGKNNIVLFTASDNIKNYDKYFHKFSTIIRREDLPCSPCQLKQKAFYWNQKGVRESCGWECRNIDPKVIVQKVKELI